MAWDYPQPYLMPLSPAASDIDGLDDGLGRHEIRAGLRLSLW